MALILLLLLAALIPHLCHSAGGNVGIVNGTEAKPHSRPYMVSLQFNGAHHCGGFLISESFVMSAAHCLEKREEDVKAVIGAHDLKANDFESIPVMKFHRHPDWGNKTEPKNDIMLLKLAKEVKISNNVDWISIPKTLHKDTDQYSACSVAGWGSKTGTNKAMSGVLLEANVTIINSNNCINTWMLPNILCTDAHRGGFCTGDSGGPLVCNNIAVGVISLFEGTNCNNPKEPYVYTDISKFLPWISKIIGRMKK